MKKRLWAAGFALLIICTCLTMGAALAQARYPEVHSVVTDDANVLSKKMVEDIVSYQAAVQSRTGVSIHVAIVHFLDGVDVQTYANTLFARWALGGNDVLLLGAAGEDTFASVSGISVAEKWNAGNAQSMLFTSGFGELFKAQQYDAAIGQYLVAFADMLNKQYNADINALRLLPNYAKAIGSGAEKAQVETPASEKRTWQDYASGMWGGFQENFNDNAKKYGESREQRVRESDSANRGGWLVLVLLGILILGQRRVRGRYADRRGCSGCGCSPLGWLFVLLGLNKRWRQ